jgi:hypothetical protein
LASVDDDIDETVRRHAVLGAPRLRSERRAQGRRIAESCRQPFDQIIDLAV